MNKRTLSLSDVQQHVVGFGLDVHPPIEMRSERTRLNLFFEDAREKFPELYEQLTSGEVNCRISKPFRKNPQMHGPAVVLETFVLTPRGPVFSFPISLPEPIGDTGLSENVCESFNQIRKMLWSAVPGHTILRVGLIRDVVFATGDTQYQGLVSRQPEWCGAGLVGGQRLFHYRDPKCNIRLECSPGRLHKTTQLPVGAKIDEPAGYALKVRLDVNNHEIRALQDADIDEVIERALGFWPDELLKYLSEFEP